MATNLLNSLCFFFLSLSSTGNLITCCWQLNTYLFGFTYPLRNPHIHPPYCDVFKKKRYVFKAQLPVHWRALHYTPWQTCSFRHQLDFLGKHSSHAAITWEDCSLTFPPPCIARCSFIQLSGLGHHGENEIAKILKRWQGENSKPGSLDCESGILSLRYCAPLSTF